MTARIEATADASLLARVDRIVPLRYATGADARLDRPAHVRAASGLAWLGDHLVVAQDDASFVAIVDPRDGTVCPVTLPAGHAGRRQFDDTIGNKAHKLDLEAVVVVSPLAAGPLVLAFGSGSTARREVVAALRDVRTRGDVDAHARVTVQALPALYAMLRGSLLFAGSEMNVEGAVWVAGDGGRLRLLNRGNGASRDGIPARNATCDLAWPAFAAHLAAPLETPPPALTNVREYDLGTIDGLALGFTDAAVLHADVDSGALKWLYTAVAEASPDATRDGPVVGGAVGVVREGPDGVTARWAPLRDREGAAFLGKVEGVVPVPNDPLRLLVVVDRDDSAVASELCEVHLEGSWHDVP